MNTNPKYLSLGIREALYNGSNDDLYPLFSGYQSCHPNHNSETIRDHYMFCYVESGYGTFFNASRNNITENTQHRMGPGDIFLVTPGSYVYYIADEKEPWTYAWFAFAGRKAGKYLSMTNFSASPVIHTELPLYKQIHDLTENVILLEDSEIRYMYALSVLLNILAGLSETSTENKEVKNINSYVERAIGIIRRSYDLPITVSDIADELGISREYFYTIFIKDIGKSPSKYMIDYRIEKACALLRESEYPVYLIAQYTGFSDTPYFSRKFHDITGMTPLGYRKLYRSQTYN